MTPEELDDACADEAERRIELEVLHGYIDTGGILRRKTRMAARLARENWSPILPETPDLRVARRRVASLYLAQGYSRLHTAIQKGWRDHSPEVQAALLSAQEDRAIAGAKEAGAFVVWEGGDCPIKLGSRIAVLFRNGEYAALTAHPHMGWRHSGQNHGYEIVQYALLEEKSDDT
jgi:hypothetical protein